MIPTLASGARYCARLAPQRSRILFNNTSRVMFAARSMQDESKAASSPSESQKPPQVPPGPPQPDELNFVKIEEKTGDSWGGVAAVDKGEDPDQFFKSLKLFAGDFAVLVLFACIGRNGHGEEIFTLETIGTALPFIIGWSGAGYFLGGYGADAVSNKLGPSFVAALKSWGLGIPIGIVLRSIQRGYIPANTFIGITMATTFVMMSAWRLGYSKFFGTSAEKIAKTASKKGNPLEFLSLLGSLTNRW